MNPSLLASLKASKAIRGGSRELMKYLLPVLVVFLVFYFSKPKTYDTQKEFIQRQRIVIEREKRRQDMDRFDQRVAKIRNALAMGEPSGFDPIRAILLSFGKDANLAIAIFKAESGLRCDAVGVNKNMTKDYGIAQINSIHKWRVGDEKKFLDCQTNINVARQIWKEQGPKPWVAYNTGKHEVFLSKIKDL